MSKSKTQTRRGPGREPVHKRSGYSKLARRVLKFTGGWEQAKGRDNG